MKRHGVDLRFQEMFVYQVSFVSTVRRSHVINNRGCTGYTARSDSFTAARWWITGFTARWVLAGSFRLQLLTTSGISVPDTHRTSRADEFWKMSRNSVLIVIIRLQAIRNIAICQLWHAHSNYWRDEIAATD